MTLLPLNPKLGGRISKEFIMGTLIPDFFFLTIFWIASFLYFRNTKIPLIISLVIFTVLVISLLPRFYITHEYHIIEVRISYHTYKINGEKYRGNSVQVYKKVFPFTYKPQSEYKDSTDQAGDIMMELYRKNYKTEDGNTLTIGDFEISLK
ncbi:hypothetical protein DTO10_22540 [Peribacillus butanolivorans]|uniref:DUF2393 domain-containing protein n=2 Tax=Peribacillus butanolivorans TaxID=421767 RepID=A0ABN5N605_9BACI|nr:hypothetical protein DTO10_22540 [Peribacillus butanolivorans]